MAAKTIKPQFAAIGPVTITLASLASSAGTTGRQGTLVDNRTTLYDTIFLGVKVKTTATTTANSVVSIYLIRDDGNASTALRTDAAGATDAALTVLNAQLIGTLNTGSTTTAQTLSDVFVIPDPGPQWTVAIVNSTGTALSATGSDHVVEYTGKNSQVG